MAFENAINRLDRVKSTMIYLVEQNRELALKNRRLNEQVAGHQRNWDANIRVLRKEIEEDVKKQIRGEDTPPPNESEDKVQL